jgi:class 3 adenylate cyclase
MLLLQAAAQLPPINVTVQSPPGMPEWIRILISAGVGAIFGVGGNLVMEYVTVLYADIDGSTNLVDSKNTTAAKTALQIKWALSKILNPALKAQYGSDAYQLSHVIGIDTSRLLAARIGVRNDNDIVWVGRAANYADAA